MVGTGSRADRRLHSRAGGAGAGWVWALVVLTLLAWLAHDSGVAGADSDRECADDVRDEYDEVDEDPFEEERRAEKLAVDVVWPAPDSSDLNVMSCWRTLKAEEREAGSQPENTVRSCKSRKAARLRHGPDTSPEEMENSYEKRMEAFKSWFERNGGELHKVEAERLEHGKCGEATLVATEDIEEGETVVRVPLKLTMNKWTMKKIQGGSPAKVLKSVFEESEEWGLAVLLVHEYFWREKSKWWPYIQVLRACELGDTVSKELKGTSAKAIMDGWWDEVDAFFSHCTDGPLKTKSQYFQRMPEKRIGSNAYSRDDLGWALNIVRKHAMPVYNNATKSTFLSLVPFADLMRHSPSAAGNSTLTATSITDFVEVSAAAHALGAPVARKLRPMSDAEALVYFHAVDEGPNPDNQVRIALPDAAGPKHNIIQKVGMLREWRKTMAMPPRASDLWIANNDLRLYGRPAEYQLPMLAGGMGGDEDGGGEVAHIYTFFAGLDVPEPDTREHRIAVSASRVMDEAVEMLENAVAAQYEDPSVVTAIAQTQDLLFYGVEPDRGLDGLDLMLIRKMNLRGECGPTSGYTISATKFSDGLLCAMRLTLASEAELDQLCPAGFHWADGCEGGLFRWRRPISRRNEEVTLQALKDTIGSILSAYPTHHTEDETLLELSTMQHPRLRAAITLRMHEQRLLLNTRFLLEEMEEKLDALRYQIFEMPKWRAPLMLGPGDPPPVIEEEPIVEVPVDFGAGTKEFVRVFAGQSLERVITTFAAKHNLSPGDAEKLAAATHARMPTDVPETTLTYAISVALPHGARTLAVYGNETVGDAVAQFCLLQGVPKESKLKLMSTISKRLKVRARQREILAVPVTAADGRKLTLRVVQGDQHDVANVVRNFVAAMILPDTAMSQLQQALEARLPPFAFNVPLKMPEPQQPLNMIVREGDDPYEISEAFIAQNDLDAGELLPKMVRIIQGKMRQLGMPVKLNHFLSRNAILDDL